MTSSKFLLMTPVIAAACLLSACDNRGDGATAGQKVDETLAKADEKVDQAKSKLGSAANDVKQSATTSANAAADSAKDMMITAGVKTQLLADPQVKAMAINVDTHAGRVVLQGSAPNTAARDRAGALAAQVDGVAGVDNQLMVAAKP